MNLGYRLVFSSGEMLPASPLGRHPALGQSLVFMRRDGREGIIRATSLAHLKSSALRSERSMLSLLHSSLCGNRLQAHFLPRLSQQPVR